MFKIARFEEIKDYKVKVESFDYFGRKKGNKESFKGTKFIIESSKYYLSFSLSLDKKYYDSLPKFEKVIIDNKNISTSYFDSEDGTDLDLKLDIAIVRIEDTITFDVDFINNHHSGKIEFDIKIEEIPN